MNLSINLLLGLICISWSKQISPISNSRPHVIFIVADDAGWNDFSFHGSPQIPTPNIDSLALTGIILNSYYASPLCTPTRGSIMTGKHPIHIRLQHYVITGGMIDGLPLEEKILPQYLKELGYATHLVGKWHLGHGRRRYTPTYRGFDSHYGNWLGAQDYFDHFYHERDGFGYDMRRNMEVEYEAFGNYTTDLYTTEALRLIQNHPKGSPLFLMVNHIAPHTGNDYQHLQAPAEAIKRFETIESIPRRIYAGMVAKLDESVGYIVEALEEAGLLDNSIIVFTSDNGGSPEGHAGNYGSNWPLRGVKNSLWEGGTRVAGFIWSHFLPAKVSEDLMHVSDWLPTLYEASGGNISKLIGIDGVSQWKNFLSNLEEPPRIKFLYNIDDIYNNSAFRLGPWKTIQGNATSYDLDKSQKWDGWYGPSGRNKSYTVQELIPLIVNSKAGTALVRSGIHFNITLLRIQQTQADVDCRNVKVAMPCDPYNSPCLFNIDDDPCERNNLADKHPEILEMLLATIHEMNSTAVEPLQRYTYPQASPKYWNHVWTNWADYTNTVP